MIHLELYVRCCSVVWKFNSSPTFRIKKFRTWALQNFLIHQTFFLFIKNFSFSSNFFSFTKKLSHSSKKFLIHPKKCPLNTKRAFLNPPTIWKIAEHIPGCAIIPWAVQLQAASPKYQNASERRTNKAHNDVITKAWLKRGPKIRVIIAVNGM